MCGINGITAERREDLIRMVSATEHRGPDACGEFVSEGIALGHNRLSVIDLSEQANQPMHSRDGRYVIVFNGEIYNYRELRTELHDQWSFLTQSDTEVLLAAYSVWGQEMLNRLRGIFAFAVWDTVNQELFLARDQMGIKPLFYAVREGVLYFSSELTGVVEGARMRTLEKDAMLFGMLLNYTPSPTTFVEGIHSLKAGHCLLFKNKTAVIKRYWMPLIPSKSTASKEQVREVIGNGVSRQLVADRPVGVLLSGGIDSSIILHHVADSLKEVCTFSVGFEMVPGYESEADKFNADSQLAERTAREYRTNHTTFHLSLENVRDSFEDSLLALDQPIANPSSVSRYLLSKCVREAGIVVALGGDGGDELFGGYDRYRMAYAAYLFQKLPHFTQKIASLMHPSLHTASIPLGSQMYVRLSALKEENYSSLIDVDRTNKVVHNFFNERFSDPAIRSLHPIDQFMRVDRETWLVDESLSETDRMSMAHGLEVRVPLLDLDIVNFADSLFVGAKFSPTTSKKILRNAYAGLLPDYLFSQPKRGWVSPGAKWFRDPVICAYVKEALSPSYYNGLNSLFDWGKIEKMLDDHIEKRSYNLYPLWNILVLQVWARKYKITL